MSNFSLIKIAGATLIHSGRALKGGATVVGAGIKVGAEKLDEKLSAKAEADWVKNAYSSGKVGKIRKGFSNFAKAVKTEMDKIKEEEGSE